MEKEISREEKIRLNSLYQQIIEIACGNFMFRQEPSGRRDPIDTIAVLLNMMSEEINYSCFNAQHWEEHPEFHFSIFLNSHYHITSYSSGTSKILKWDDKNLNRPVSVILSNNSLKALKEELGSNKNQTYQRLIPLDFLTENKSLYRVPCTIQKMTGINSDCSYVITAFRFGHKNEDEEVEENNTSDPSKLEKKESAATKLLLKQVRLYILRNLHTELPSLKELGLIHRTNKTKLKEEFKKIYGTTIPRFHMEKRLEKGALLIRSTELPISIITQKCGFKDHSHFSKNFRRHYGQTPSLYRMENAWSIQ